MIAQIKHCLAVFTLGAVIAAAGPAAPQDSFARQDQLQDLSVELSGIATRVQQSVITTMASMENLATYSGDEQTEQAFQILDAIEDETRGVIDTIKVTSPFVSALDDARANVLVLLRRNERDPPSPSRDARIAALTTALASIEDQSQQILAAEGTLTRLLSDHALLRAELIRNGEVRAVQGFVADLSNLTAGLDQMASVLAEISQNVVVVPTDASLATE